MKVEFKWNNKEKKASNIIKNIITRDTIIIYNNFNKHFDINPIKGIIYPILKINLFLNS